MAPVTTLTSELRKEAARVRACMKSQDYALRSYAEHIHNYELLEKAADRLDQIQEERYDHR